MAFKSALVILAAVLAVQVVRADDPLHSDLNDKFNNVCDQLLGGPCKESPPPPPPMMEPPVPPPEETTPAPSPELVPAPVPAPMPMGPAPVPAPAPLGTGTANGIMIFVQVSGLPLSPGQLLQLQVILQGFIGNNGVITLSFTATGRKLLQGNSVTFTVEGVTSCDELFAVLRRIFAADPSTGRSELIDAAYNATPPIDLTLAEIPEGSCAGPDAGSDSITVLSPAGVPAALTPLGPIAPIALVPTPALGPSAPVPAPTTAVAGGR